MKKYLVFFLLCATLSIHSIGYGAIRLTKKVPGTFLDQYYYTYTKQEDKTTFIKEALKEVKGKKHWIEIWNPTKEKLAVGVDKKIVVANSIFDSKRKIMGKFVLKLRRVVNSYYPVFKGANPKSGVYWWENNKKKAGKNSPYMMLLRGKRMLTLHIHEVINRHAYPLALVNNKKDKTLSVTFMFKNKVMLLSPYYAIYIPRYNCTIIESFYDTFSTNGFKYILKDAAKRGFIGPSDHKGG